MSDTSNQLGDYIHKTFYPLREGKPFDLEAMIKFQHFLRSLSQGLVDDEGRVDAVVASQLCEVYPLMLGVAAGHKEESKIEDWAIDLQDDILDLLRQ